MNSTSDDLEICDPLELSIEDMRRLGYRVVDIIVSHLTNLKDKRVTRRASRDEMEKLLREPPPKKRTSYENVLAQLETQVFANMMYLDHPRFFAFVPGPSNYVGIMGEVLAAGFNVFNATWLEASGPAEVELVTIDWLRQFFGMPETAGGLFVSGGSVANLTALAVARQKKLKTPDDKSRAMIYCSDQTHSSIERALNLLGFDDSQLQKIQTDDKFRLNPQELKSLLEEDRGRGKIPFCVIANAGTTNTGAVDPIPELSTICKKEDMWLHVDGSYGASAVLSEKGKTLFGGLENSDSISVDPHKWLFQPFEIGCVLLRDFKELKDTFQIIPEYLRDASQEVSGEINFCDYGIQLTRGFRALKLWMSLKVFGTETFGKAIEHGIEMAEFAENTLRNLESFEVVTSALLGIVTFNWVNDGDKPGDQNASFNRELVEAMIADGFAMISTTVLKGRSVLRMCTINPRITRADIVDTIRRIDMYGKKIATRSEGSKRTY